MDNKILFGVMCIIFNSIGVPCFMQGEVKTGVLRIVLAFISFGIIGFINEIMGIILGVKVLCMSDADYEEKKMKLSLGVPNIPEGIQP